MLPILLLLTLALAGQAQNLPVSFNHGVASGDPLSTGIILWTRVTPRELDTISLASLAIPVNWVVSTTPTFMKLAASGQLTTTIDRDFTVKVDVSGLKANASYFYMFFVAGGAVRSPVGRFRLPPATGKTLDQIRYAVFSCANWGYGYFNAYDAASRYNLDFWVHLGDFIYEYGVNVYPSPSAAVRFQAPPLGLQPPHELISLSDYRTRHALYRQDPGLQALSASAPLIAAWDDHEVANDGWMDGAENHQQNEGDWNARKAAGIKAYHEWMPTRPRPADPISFYRSFQFGNLATLLMLETRYLARTNPAPGGALNDAFTSIGQLGFAILPPSQWNEQMAAAATALATQADTIRNQPNRTVLGTKQLQWIRQATKISLSSKTTWQLYGQDTVMLDQFAPDLNKTIAAEKNMSRRQLWQAALTNLTDASANHTTSIYTKMPRWSYLRGLTIPVATSMKYAIRSVLALARFKITWIYDSWSGYQAEKARFLNAITRAAADAGLTSLPNAVVYGGDSHNAWAGVHRVNGSDVAVEFDVMGVTSPGFEDYIPFIPLDLMAAGMVKSNPGMVYSNLEDKGFMLVTLTHKKHRVDMMKLDTIGSMNYKLLCDASFEVAAGSKAMKRVPCSKPPAGTPYATAVTLNGGLGQSFSAVP